MEDLQIAMDAIDRGDTETLSRVLGQNPHVVHERNTDNDTVLHIACWCKQIGCVGIILAHNPDVNARGCYGRTPLHYAVHEGNAITPAIVGALLSKRADPTIRDDNGFTPLDWAKVEMTIGLPTTIELLSKATK